MRYLITITVVFGILAFPRLTNAGNFKFISSNPKDSSYNPDNSEYNPKNSPYHPANSPYNPQNSPYNPNRQNGIYDENGNSIGYTTPKAGGGVNIYDNEGHRKGYSTNHQDE